MGLYGLAVGAALAAGASTVDASLITLDLTGQPVGSRTTPAAGNLYFDVNAASAAAAFSTSNFAAADFVIHNSVFGTSTFSARIGGTHNVNNAVARFSMSALYFANNFAASHLVGPPDVFGPFGYIRTYGGNGAFGVGSTGYLGLKFIIGSDIHYGWANITVGAGDLVTLNSLGYESLPNVPAHTEAPSQGGVPDGGNSLLLLATGAAGLIAFRARKGKAA